MSLPVPNTVLFIKPPAIIGKPACAGVETCHTDRTWRANPSRSHLLRASQLRISTALMAGSLRTASQCSLWFTGVSRVRKVAIWSACIRAARPAPPTVRPPKRVRFFSWSKVRREGFNNLPNIIKEENLRVRRMTQPVDDPKIISAINSIYLANVSLPFDKPVLRRTPQVNVIHSKLLGLTGHIFYGRYANPP